MAIDFSAAFPRQNLQYKSKGKEWRHQCVDWIASRSYFHYAPVRLNAVNMKINYDLMNGIIHMEDVAKIINPDNLSMSFIPDKIQHYPIINSKINTLRGEEAARAFNWHAIVTNPNAISKIEENKHQQFLQSIQDIVESPDLDQTQAENQVRETKDYFDYDWQDVREVGCNELLRHYMKEQNFKQTFNNGFVDACANNVEVYQCGIHGGEPFMCKLNPLKLRSYRSGYSNRLEDADIVAYEDYWSPGRIFEVYYDELSQSDIKKLTDLYGEYGGVSPTGAAGNYNEAYPFYGQEAVFVDGGNEVDWVLDELDTMEGGLGSNLIPYDVAGNIRVVQVWWKSLRKIYSVKSFDPETGEEVLDFYPETYVPDEDAGEVATPLWINEMWQGTKIGDDIYVGIHPCVVQHNSISNPSRCHSGIVGTIYNINESRPYSLVDMMKPYNYLYDAVHAKLVDLIATNWGKLLELDLALKPKNWEVEKWIYFARKNKTLIKDSFNEGNKGAALGKLAGGLNNASKGYIDADWGQSIQNYIEILQWTKDSMSELVGINRQREGNTYNRETVGGIERAVLQSSYITDWLFQQHDDTKRRVLECFLEYAKAAIRGRSKKFQYIMSDGSRRMMEINGDLFCENDYGIVVDNSIDSQKLESQIETIAQAALQNQFRFSSILKLYTSASIQEKIRIIEKAEKDMAEQQAQTQQAEQQLAQQQIQAQMQQKQMEIDNKNALAELDAQTKIQVAEINSRAEYMRLGIYAEENDEQLVHDKLDVEREKLAAEIQKLNKEFELGKDKLKLEERKYKDEIASKEKIEHAKLAKASSTKKQ